MTDTPRYLNIASWWTLEAIRTWAQGQLSNAQITDADVERLQTLLGPEEDRMRVVAGRLEARGRDKPQRTVRFLETAWQATNTWRERGHNVADRQTELAKLAAACTSAASLLSRERQMAAYVLAFDAQLQNPANGGLEHADDPSIKNPAYMEPANQRLTQLSNDLLLIAGAATHGWDYYPVEPELPRARNFEQREEIFCIKLLLRAAKVAFDAPMIQEVGEIIAVLFKKGEDNDQYSRVQDIWRQMRANKEYPMMPI